MTPELKTKILAAAGGTQTGALLACVLGVERAAPYFTGKGTITSDGFLMCNFVDRDNQHHHGAFVGSFSDLTANLIRLRDFMQMSKADYNELTLAVSSWISQDYRSASLAGRR